jgi:DNA-binding transcriptional LysR family regulator
MELRTLRTFIAVAAHRSFTLAAEELFLTQPAVSQQIRALETDLGATLFSRDRGTVELTEAGHTLLPRARDILALADGTRGLLDSPRAVGGRLRIVAATFASSFLYVGLYERFVRRYPEVHIEITAALGREVALAAVRSGDADAAFMQFPIEADDLVEHLLGTTSIVAVTAPGPRPSRVLLWDGTLETQRALAAAGTDVGVLTNDVVLLKSLAARGAGIAYVPHWSVVDELASGALIRVHVSAVAPRQRFGIVHRAAERAPALDAFVATAHDYAPTIAGLT